MTDTRHVLACYDPDAGVWWAESEDLPGLVSEAPTLDELVDRVTAAAGELLAANGVSADGISLEIMTTRLVETA